MPNPRAALVLKRLGLRVAELRRARGWTQEQFAVRIECSFKYLQRIEAGRENLTVESLLKLASKLGVGLTDLFAMPANTKRPTGRPKRTKE